MMLEISSQFQTIHFSSIDSTQRYAEEHIDELVVGKWRVVVADQQLKGEGTHGRKWSSPPGNLYATFSIKIPSKNIFSENLFKIPQLAAICIIQLLKNLDLNPKYKWVNDILLQEKKVSGILCSSKGDNNGNTIIHIGIGINVALSAKECNEISQATTSLNLELNSPVTTGFVLDNLKKILATHFNYFLKNGQILFKEELDHRLAFKNTSIIFDLHNKNHDVVRGILRGVDENGLIIIEHESSGKLEHFISGRILKIKSLA